MRLLAITAGAADMYCGSCLRDNALATEMMARGHDVTLLPVYTPTVTDEPNVSEDRVFFGGISVYLQQHVPLFRHTPWVMDRLWDSAAVIKAFAGRSVAIDPAQLGELTVSMLEGEQGFQAKEIEKLAHWLARQPRFELICLPNSLLLGLAPALARAGRCGVACTLQGEDLFLEGLGEPYRSRSRELIRERAGAVDGFIAVSDYYAGFMAGYLGLPRERIHVAPLGINMRGHDPERAARSGPFTVGYFARVAPEKGLHLLCEAYGILRRERGLPASRLLAAGYLLPEHRPYLEKAEARMRELGLEGEFEYRGVLDRAAKLRFLQEVDVLSVPSPYAEPKGLYVLEALASGVPVVQPRHGAFPEILKRTGGGLLFEPGDLGGLADALLSLWKDAERARELGREGARGVRRHYDLARMADVVVEAYRGIISRSSLRDKVG